MTSADSKASSTSSKSGPEFIGSRYARIACWRQRYLVDGVELRRVGVLEAYALISHESHGHRSTELAALLHRDEQIAGAEQKLRDMVRDLLTEAVHTGYLRDDIAPDELASYCLHALTAASRLRSKAAVRRLVTVTLAGLRPPR